MRIPFLSDTNFVDDAELSFGNSSDLKIYHSGSHSYISDVGTGNLLISGTNLWLSDAATGENFLRATSNGAVQIYYDGAEKFTTTSTGVDVTGTVNLDNLTINGAQGSDGQVLTSTSQGIAWEDATGGGASLSGGEASKVAVWSATDTLTHHDDFHFDTTNVRLGIGDSNPNRPLVVSETRTDSTASDAYTTVVKSVQGSGLSTNPGTGGLKVQYTSSSSNVHAFGLVAGSSSSDFLTTGPMHFYTNSDLDTVSATGFAMQLDTSQRLILGSMTASQKLNVSGSVTADRYYGNTNTNYYIDPNEGTGASAVLNGAVSIGSTSTYTKLSVTTPAGYGDGADGIFIRSTFAGSSPVVSDKDPFLSIGCSDSSGAVSTIFMGEDATATSQESKIEYSHDNATLGIFVTGQGSYREHVRFGNQSSSTARTRFYGNVGVGTNPSSPLHVAGDIQTATGSVKIADNWGQGFYSAEQLSIVGSYPSLALRNNSTDNKWLIHHDGNDLTFYAGADFDSTSWSKKVQVDSGNQGMGAKIFYDLDSSGYYLDPASSSVALNINGKIAQAKEDYDIDGNHPNAIYQATRATQTDRGTWPSTYMYAVNFGDRTKGIQLGSRYGGANELYFRSGTDNSSSENGANAWKNWRQLYHVDYHPEADKWTTARTITLAGDLTGSVQIDGSGDVTLTASVNDDSHDLTWANIDGETANSVNSWGGLRHQTNDGYIDFGPANSSHAHIYTDMPNFYFNKELRVNNQQVFHTGYHPNADTWTTARTITIGSTGKSVNGSGNVSWTLGEIGAAAAGDENIIDGAYSIWNPDGDGDVFVYDDNNPTHNGKGVGAVIDIKGDGVELSSLIRAGIYTGDHVSVSRGYYVGTALDTTNTNTTQVINSSGYWTGYPVFPYDSFSKTDISARTETGFYQDSSPTSGEGWPALGGNTSWAHLISCTHSNNSNYYAMQLSASFYNQNLYYRSTAGSGTTGWSKMWSDQNDGAGSGLDADYLDGQHGSYYALRDHIRSLGTQAFTGTATTAGLISEMEGDGAFDSYSSVFKTSWSYAGNFNLSDAGRFTETAGTSFLTWTDNSSDSTRGNITVLAIAPNTGGSAGKMFVYNDQGSSYAPGWREIWTSTSDGSGSGLDADLLDGSHKTSFLYDQGGGDFRYNPGGSVSTLYLGQTPTSNTGSAFINCVKQNYSNMPGAIYFYISPASTTNSTSSTYLKHIFKHDGDAHHDGDVIAYSTSTGSDKKLKKNIRDLEGALDKTLKLRGVKFDWKDENKANDQLGFIAQEVENVIPEVVKEVKTISKDDETHLTVNYPALVPLLTEAIKEQQDQINELKTMLEKLTNQLNNGNNI